MRNIILKENLLFFSINEHKSSEYIFGIKFILFDKYIVVTLLSISSKSCFSFKNLYGQAI